MQQDSSATDAGTASSTPEKATATAKVPLTAVGRSESLKAQKKAQIKPGVRKKSDPAHFYRDDIEDFAEQNGGDTAPVSAGSSSTSVQSLPTDGSLLFEDDDADFDADPEHRPNWQAILTDPSDGDTLGRSSFFWNKEFLFKIFQLDLHEKLIFYFQFSVDVFQRNHFLSNSTIVIRFSNILWFFWESRQMSLVVFRERA